MISDINQQIAIHERAVEILGRIKKRVHQLQLEKQHLENLEVFNISEPRYTEPVKQRIRRITRVWLPMLHDELSNLYTKIQTNESAN